MRFVETPLRGALVVELEPHADERGLFARTFCQQEFARQGLDPQIVQCNLSYNRVRGTLRGLHFQKAPHAEAKLVRCVRGRIFDVIVDLRRDSPTLLKWFAVELSAENRQSLYIPQGFAHGFQALEDHSDVFYQMAASYQPDYARGVRWDDPEIAIQWPITPPVVGGQDGDRPSYRELERAGDFE